MSSEDFGFRVDAPSQSMRMYSLESDPDKENVLRDRNTFFVRLSEGEALEKSFLMLKCHDARVQASIAEYGPTDLIVEDDDGRKVITSR